MTENERQIMHTIMKYLARTVTIEGEARQVVELSKQFGKTESESYKILEERMNNYHYFNYILQQIANSFLNEGE
jgi:uncharacterized protein YpbB